MAPVSSLSFNSSIASQIYDSNLTYIKRGVARRCGNQSVVAAYFNNKNQQNAKILCSGCMEEEDLKKKKKNGSIKRREALLGVVFTAFSLPSIASAENVEMESDNMTALQKHVAFFDRNKDGVIYPSETYQGFRAIGCGRGLSIVSTAPIHLGLSSSTRPGKPPSLLFPIEVATIALSNHGSDSGTYDAEGRFVPSKFEEIFQKHARSNPNSLTEDELSAMLEANAQPNDTFGKTAAKTEWKLLYTLCKDKNGLLQKDTIRAVFDGSLFYEMEKNKGFIR